VRAPDFGNGEKTTMTTPSQGQQKDGPRQYCQPHTVRRYWLVLPCEWSGKMPSFAASISLRIGPRIILTICPDRGKSVAHDVTETLSPWVRTNVVSNATHSTVIVKRYWTWTPRVTARARSRNALVGQCAYNLGFPETLAAMPPGPLPDQEHHDENATA
jgi:hypothetical protein